MSEAENEGKQGVYVYANLIDANGDGKVDISALKKMLRYIMMK